MFFGRPRAYFVLAKYSLTIIPYRSIYQPTSPARGAFCSDAANGGRAAPAGRSVKPALGGPGCPSAPTMRGCLQWLDEAALGAAKAAPTRPRPRGGPTRPSGGRPPRAPLGSTVPGSKDAAVECREARRVNPRRRLARQWLAPSGAPPPLALRGGAGDLAKSGAVRRAETNPHILGDLRHDRPRPCHRCARRA